MSGQLLTTQAAANYCGIGVQTLYNHLSNGTGPKQHKQGRRNAFYQSDLDEWNKERLILVEKQVAS